MEAKIQATDRLRNEGRWNDACAFRDAQRQRLKAEGMSRHEAAERSWQAMLERFPPLPTPELPDTGDYFPLDRVEPVEQNLGRDILWVYSHLDHRTLTPGDAPSAGAWHLLTFARTDRSEFFKNLLPKAMPKSDGPCPACEQRRLDEEQTQKLIDLCRQEDPNLTDEERLKRVLEGWNTIVCPNCRTRFFQDDAPDEPPYDPATVWQPGHSISDDGDVNLEGESASGA